MTIDERLDRLTERHEALTQTVEIIAGMQRENEARMGRLEQSMLTLTDTMNRLANIVISHEEPLDSLDGGDTE